MLTNKILLIDDDPEEFEIFCDALAKVDDSIDCVPAFSCSEGFQKMDSSEGLPKYIFLDLNMPQSHGKYCLEKIKKHPTYNSIPVFIYTTSSRELDKALTQRLGAESFFTKPDNEKGLLKILSYVVSGQWKSN